MEGFGVARWLAAHPANSCASVHVSQPQQLGAGWTKAPAAAGGGYRHGDASGRLSRPGVRCRIEGFALVLQCSLPAHQARTVAHLLLHTCTPPACPRCAGLLPFALPRLPASLDEGGYVAKSAEEDVGVETVCRAAAAAGARLAECDVLTFRNNLNK